MNNILRLTTLVLLASCENTKIVKSPQIEIDLSAVPIENNQLYVIAKNDFQEKIDEDIPVKEVPFQPNYMGCGGVYSTDDEVKELLENAEVIYTFTGVSEKWTPINGRPKEYYVFTVKFK